MKVSRHAGNVLGAIMVAIGEKLYASIEYVTIRKKEVGHF